MKKIIPYVFLMFLFTSNAYSAPCYGTKLPKQKNFFVGVQNHTIFKRYLENEFGKIRSTQNFLLLSYGVFDWFSIDLKGGAGSIKQHPLGSDENDFPSSFNGGYGFRLRVWENESTKMVFGFQHISVHPKKIHLENIEYTAILDGWQFSLLTSRDFKKITPYIGTVWSRVDYIRWVEEDRKRRMSDLTKSIGLVFGFDLPLTEKIWINLEGRAFDGESAAFSVNYAF